jgi:hypothetical protein
MKKGERREKRRKEEKKEGGKKRLKNSREVSLILLLAFGSKGKQKKPL